MNSQNFYDQLASDDFVTSQNPQFQNELKQIQTGLDKDLGLQDSSGLVNPLGLKGDSMYQNHQKGGRGAPAPNFGNRQQVDLLGGADVEPSARNPRESADLTIDMLMGNKGALAARR